MKDRDRELGIVRHRQEDAEKPSIQQQGMRGAAIGGRHFLGQSAPSTGAKIGSLPVVAIQRALIFWTLTLIALGGRWQVTQVRPLLPKL